MTRGAIYLDHNASAPLLPEAKEALLAALDLTGNPSSVHGHGRALRNLVEAARAQIATAAGAERSQVVFTGSATEAITQAVVAGARHLGVDAVLVSGGEHAAVLRAAEATGLPVKSIGLDEAGVIRIEEIAQAVKAADSVGMKLLVCVHLVNNETGVVQPVEAMEAMVGPTPHFLFVDAAQAFGKLPLEFAARATDMMALSGHKIGAPAGVGALLMKGHTDAVRLIPGGGQETGRRGGTEAVTLLASFGAAATAFPDRYRSADVTRLIRQFEDGLRALAPDSVVFGENARRLGNASNFAVPGLKSAVAMMGLDLAGISVSSGSACSSGKVGPSHVLAAMGVPALLSEGALRVSFGWNSTSADVDACLEELGEVVARHRRRHGQAA